MDGNNISLLDPKLDLVFKKLLERKQEILMDLLNAILNWPQDHRITEIEILNPSSTSSRTTKGKQHILDLSVKDQMKRQYDIEMQSNQETPKRFIAYVGRVYAEQLDKGGGYKKLKTTIGINFVDYNLDLGDSKDLKCRLKKVGMCFILKEIDCNFILTDAFQLFFFELTKVNDWLPLKEENAEQTFLVEFLYFLKYINKKGWEDEFYTDPRIKQLHKELEIMSQDDVLQEEARQRFMEKTYIPIMLGEAEERGMEKGKEEGRDQSMQVIAMSNKGVSSEEIATKISLSLAEVVKIIEGYQELLH